MTIFLILLSGQLLLLAVFLHLALGFTKGQQHMANTLDDLSNDMTQLKQQVARIVGDLQAQSAQLATALAAPTIDVDKVTALHEQMQATIQTLASAAQAVEPASAPTTTPSSAGDTQPGTLPSAGPSAG